MLSVLCNFAELPLCLKLRLGVTAPNHVYWASTLGLARCQAYKCIHDNPDQKTAQVGQRVETRTFE